MDSELTILKEQITSLRAEVSTFQETKVAVGELRTTFSSIDNKFLLSERLSILEKELTNWKTLAQYLGVTFSIAALVFGYLGYQSLDKFLGEQIIFTRINEYRHDTNSDKCSSELPVQINFAPHRIICDSRLESSTP